MKNFLKFKHKLIRYTCFVILLMILNAVPFYALRKTWSSDRFVYDAVLGIETIEGSPDRLLVWGKNYEKVEAKVALVEIKNKKVDVIWESQNFYERGSNLMCAFGSFTSRDQEVVVLAEDLWKIYKVEVKGLKEIASGTGITGIMEVTAGDIDGDGKTELILTSVHELLKDTIDKNVVVYKYQGGKLAKANETKGLGNIRAITALDFTGDRLAEIVIEVGSGYKQGQVVVLQDLKPIVTANLRPQPIFALSHLGDTLLVGDDSGAVNLYRLELGNNAQLEHVGTSVSVGWGLVDVASGNFLGTKNDQVVVVSAPTGISILEER